MADIKLPAKQYHNILEKQLQAYLEDGGSVTPALDVLMQSVSKTYKMFERDKMLADHAFAVSEKKYEEVLSDVGKQNEIIKESIQQIKNAITELNPNSNFINEGSGTEIINIIDYFLINWINSYTSASYKTSTGCFAFFPVPSFI